MVKGESVEEEPMTAAPHLNELDLIEHLLGVLNQLLPFFTRAQLLRKTCHSHFS